MTPAIEWVAAAECAAAAPQLARCLRALDAAIQVCVAAAFCNGTAIPCAMIAQRWNRSGPNPRSTVPFYSTLRHTYDCHDLSCRTHFKFDT